jgi:HEAT repeat protein
MKNGRNINGLIKALTHKYFWSGLLDSDIRAAAANALGDIGDPRAVNALSEVLANDEYGSVKKAAAKALGKIKDKSSVNILLAMMNKYQADLFVEESIEEALGETGDPSVVVPLIEKMKERLKPFGGRRASHGLIKAVAGLGDIRATDILTTALRQDDLDQGHARNSEVVIQGLVRIGKPAVDSLLIQIKGHLGPVARTQMKRALQKFGVTYKEN